ncbi:unnamed protein product [Blepharisma stoltei]|uniref:Uncharacterized protein n=1 Tax=Blepharisma stoltei TaxID=1481888 RepID=A0AAU9KFX5_9CILI|nr:unnamed protein product [Blepharisma stoltei]
MSIEINYRENSKEQQIIENFQLIQHSKATKKQMINGDYENSSQDQNNFTNTEDLSGFFKKNRKQSSPFENPSSNWKELNFSNKSSRNDFCNFLQKSTNWTNPSSYSIKEENSNKYFKKIDPEFKFSSSFQVKKGRNEGFETDMLRCQEFV